MAVSLRSADGSFRVPAAGAAARRWAAALRPSARAWAWARLLGMALGAAAFTAGAQLGLAYGLGLLRFGAADSGGIWSTQLTWVVWCAALAVLGGATATAWLARRHGQRLALGGRVATAAVAGAGAAVMMPLTALPARVAELGTRDPALEASIAAGFGVVMGILATVFALSRRQVAVSVAAVVAAAWLLALVSVAPSLDPATDTPVVRLGVLDLPWFGDGLRSTVGALSPAVLALLVGGVMAALARRRGQARQATLVAAPAGAVLLGFSYLISGPGPTGSRTLQIGPYAGSLAAIAAALLAAFVVAVARKPLLRKPTLRMPAFRLPSPRLPSLRKPAWSLRLPGRRAAEGAPSSDSPSVDSPSVDSPSVDSQTLETPAVPADRPPAPALTPKPPAPASVGQPAAPAAPNPTPIPAQRQPDETPKKSRGWRSGRAKAGPPPVPAAEEEYVGWVKGLGGEEPAEAAQPVRRRLRPGSGEELHDPSLAPPPPPHVPGRP